MPLFGARHPTEPQTPRVTEARLLGLELLNGGALQTVRQITGPIGPGDLVTVTPRDPTNWHSVELNATIRAVGVADIDYGDEQHFSFLTLEQEGQPAWLSLEGEGKNRSWRAFAFRFLDDVEIVEQLAWCLQTYLDDTQRETRDFLLAIGGAAPFDDGSQKVWTAFSARHGVHTGLLGDGDSFPALRPDAAAEYQDCTFCIGDAETSPIFLRFIAMADYQRALIGEALGTADVTVSRTS